MRLVLLAVLDGVENPEEHGAVDWVVLFPGEDVVDHEAGPQNPDCNFFLVDERRSQPKGLEHDGKVQHSGSGSPTSVDAKSKFQGDPLNPVETLAVSGEENLDCRVQNHQDSHGREGKTCRSVLLEKDEPYWANELVQEEPEVDVSEDQVVVSVWHKAVRESLVDHEDANKPINHSPN